MQKNVVLQKYLILVTDTTNSHDNQYKIRDEKLQYDINTAVAKISTPS